jgi:hypothetical protein
MTKLIERTSDNLLAVVAPKIQASAICTPRGPRRMRPGRTQGSIAQRPSTPSSRLGSPSGVSVVLGVVEILAS